MYKRAFVGFIVPALWADFALALASSCPQISTPAEYNWMNDLIFESYSYEVLENNPVQNISGDSMALDLRVLALIDDGTVKEGDQVRITLTNGAKFAAHSEPQYAVSPSFTLELDLGGAGTGNLAVATLAEANPVGGDTLTFNLQPESFVSGQEATPVVFNAPPEPCEFYSSEGLILSGGNVAGQATNFTFDDEPWEAQDVTMQIDFLRSGSKLFGGERVLFRATDWAPDLFPEDPLEYQDTDNDGIGDSGDAGGVGRGIRVTAADTLESCAFDGPVTTTAYGELSAPGQPIGDQLSFTLSGCGDSVTVEALFAEPLPENAVAFKVSAEGEWTRIPEAVIEGNKISYTIADDGVLDDNKTPGIIVDPVTAVVLPVSVPVLPLFGLFSLAGLIALLAAARRRG